MAKKPNIPCASGCGKLLWPGRTTLPVGVAACRSCWRPASRDTAKAARDAPLQHLRGHGAQRAPDVPLHERLRRLVCR